MANEFVQTMSDARVDARSLSEFLFKPAGFKVTRRLAPTIDTLQFYVNNLSLAVTEAEGQVAYIETTVQDAINNTAIEGGVLADTFVTATANGVGTIARTQRDVNKDSVSVKAFGAKGDGVTDDTIAINTALSSGLRYIHFPPEGDYSITSALEVKGNTTVVGNNSKITSVGINQRVFTADSQDNITIKGFSINGNLTGLGGLAKGSLGGQGVFILKGKNIRVLDCDFYNIGNGVAVTSLSCIETMQCEGVTISGNFFGESCVTANGADISASYYCSRVIVTDNRSESEQDGFIYVSAVGINDEDTTRNVISNNIGVRKPTSEARSGIICPYNGKASFTTISGNVLSGFPANGIYLQTGDAAIDANSGGCTVTGNIVIYCGGSESMLGLSSGIYVGGNNGATCTGNLVYGTGYLPDMTARFSKVPAIKIHSNNNGLTVVGNTIKNTYGEGIRVSTTGTSRIIGLLISSNTIVNQTDNGIALEGNGLDNIMESICLSNNSIETTSSEYIGGRGIYIRGSGGFIHFRNITISSNNISCSSDLDKLGVDDSGIELVLAGDPDAAGIIVSENNISNYNSGFKLLAYTLSDKSVGNNVIVKGNTVTKCSIGVNVGLNGTKAAVIYQNFLTGNINDVSNTAGIFQSLNTASKNRILLSSSAPVNGVWLTGDRVLNSAPALGSPSSWIYIADAWVVEHTVPI